MCATSGMYLQDYGAFLNDTSIQVGEQQYIEVVIVTMGSPPGVECINMSILGVKVLMPKVRTIPMLEGTALMLARVANWR